MHSQHLATFSNKKCAKLCKNIYKNNNLKIKYSILYIRNI